MKEKKMCLWLIAAMLFASCEPDRIVEDTISVEEQNTELVTVPFFHTVAMVELKNR